MANKNLLAWVLKGSIEEFKDFSIEDIRDKYIEGEPEISTRPVMDGEKIQGLSNEDSSLTEGLIKFDIFFFVRVPQTGELIKMFVNLEIQDKYFPGYPLVTRGVYYGSRLISSQRGSEFIHSNYGEIKKVYSVWICTTPPKGWENTITRYRMTEENVIGKVKQNAAHYDLLTVVMIHLAWIPGYHNEEFRIKP